jgi:hypothetical protein
MQEEYKKEIEYLASKVLQLFLALNSRLSL